MTTWCLGAWTLFQREWVRFFRQRNRVIGAFATPLLFWIFMGAGLSSSFKPASMAIPMSAAEFLFPGTMALIILFTSIFSTISIIEDRREGFLQGVLVSPLPSSSLVIGKLAGGTGIALIQTVVFLCLGPLVGVKPGLAAVAGTLLVATMMGMTLTALGFVIAWRMDSVQGFHAIMNLFLIPMWLLSGAFFPVEGAPLWLEILMKINPMTYSVNALRAMLYSGGMGDWTGSSGWIGSLGITVTWGAALIFMACGMVRKWRSA